MAGRTFTELVDWLLIRLSKEEGLDYPDLVELAEALEPPPTRPEIWEAAHVLRDAGLIEALFQGGMNVNGRITGFGRMRLENALREAEVSPGAPHVVSIEGSGNQVVVGAGGDVQQVSIGADSVKRALDLIEEALHVIAVDDSLSPDERETVVSDLETAREQLRRQKPNLAAARALVAPAMNLVPVASLAVEIFQALHG